MKTQELFKKGGIYQGGKIIHSHTSVAFSALTRNKYHVFSCGETGLRHSISHVPKPYQGFIYYYVERVDFAPSQRRGDNEEERDHVGETTRKGRTNLE